MGSGLASKTFIILLAVLAGGQNPLNGQAAAVTHRCIRKQGREGLSISFKVTEEACLLPFIANVVDANLQTHKCTGVLWKPDVVVVPAACVDAKSALNVKPFPLVRVGNRNLNRQEGSKDDEEMIRTCVQIVHSAFDGNPENGHDLALLKLQKNVTIHAPIAGMISEDKCDQKDMSAFGWFKHSLNGAPSEFLEIVPKLKHVPRPTCEKLLHKLSGRICTSTDPSAQPVSDLGALLLCKEEFLVGLASYSAESKQEGLHAPLIYTSTFQFQTWIDALGEGQSTTHINPHPDCQGVEVCQSSIHLDSQSNRPATDHADL